MRAFHPLNTSGVQELPTLRNSLFYYWKGSDCKNVFAYNKLKSACLNFHLTGTTLNKMAFYYIVIS